MTWQAEEKNPSAILGTAISNHSGPISFHLSDKTNASTCLLTISKQPSLDRFVFYFYNKKSRISSFCSI